MSNKDSACWPKAFAKNNTDFLDEPVENVLATQLCAWGNIYMGISPPDNFFEVMDGCSKVTQVFTPEECKGLFNAIMLERRNNNRKTTDDDE